MCVDLKGDYESGLKSSYDIISVVDNFFDQWDPSTTTLTEEVYDHKDDYKRGLKSSYNDVISAVDDFSNQWNQSTETLMKKVCELQKDFTEK